MPPAVTFPEIDFPQLLQHIELLLQEHLESAPWNWLQSCDLSDKKTLFLAFGLTSRKVGRDDLHCSQQQLSVANKIRTGWYPVQWSVDQLARTWLILKAQSKAAEFPALLDQLFAVGEVQELITLYQLLPLLEHQERYIARALEGVRTNIKPVFCAVAHNNPFPAEQFSTASWNQMILKALFIDAGLDRIYRVDDRANSDLTTMLLDYADERFAAKRPIPVELWRPVGAFPSDRAVQTLKRTFEHGNEIEHRAAGLALNAINTSQSQSILKTDPPLTRRLQSGELTWSTLTTGC